MEDKTRLLEKQMKIRKPVLLNSLPFVYYPIKTSCKNRSVWGAYKSNLSASLLKIF